MTHIGVIRSLGLGLDEKAIEAVKRWKFKPATNNGTPVTAKATIEMNFRLWTPAASYAPLADSESFQRTRSTTAIPTRLHGVHFLRIV